MKWLLVGIAVVVLALPVLYLGLLAYFNLVGNDRVTRELIDAPSGERAGIVMLLTFPDGQQLPVNYLQEGNQVFAGADGRWWRSFRAGDVPVMVWIRGQQRTGRARVVLDDPDYTRDVFSRLRPTAPSWLPEWLNGKLVVIDLDAAAGDAQAPART